MAKFFSDAGLNIVTDKDAKCVIVYDGYITMYRNGPPEAPLPFAEYSILDQKPKVPFALPPLLSEANASADMEKSVNIMGARDGWGLSTSGKIAAGAIGAVSALLPIGTFVSVLSGASVADVVSTIHGKMITPLGLAHAGIVIKRKDWIGYSPIIIINVYAAATTTESPAALLRAAVNGGVAELQAKEDVYYHREPKKVEAATTAASAPVAAPVVGDAAVSSIPATVPLISEPAVSSPVAAPVSVESAASAPAPAQVVSDATNNP
jgi:hypothetical protein